MDQAFKSTVTVFNGFTGLWIAHQMQKLGRVLLKKSFFYADGVSIDYGNITGQSFNIETEFFSEDVVLVGLGFLAPLGVCFCCNL